MSAPVTERPRTRTTPIPAQRVEPVVAPRRREKKDTSAAKAYARRDERLRRLLEGLQPREGATAGRAPFVLLVMVLLAVGLVATLWLSTAATADSYVLQDARDNARALREQSERLHREVAAMDSAPELARRAGELGMVPVQDPARLVVAPDGAAVPPEGQEAPAQADALAQGQDTQGQETQGQGTQAQTAQGQQPQGQQQAQAQQRAQGQRGAGQQGQQRAEPGANRSAQGQGGPPERGTGRD